MGQAENSVNAHQERPWAQVNYFRGRLTPPKIMWYNFGAPKPLQIVGALVAGGWHPPKFYGKIGGFHVSECSLTYLAKIIGA